MSYSIMCGNSIARHKQTLNVSEEADLQKSNLKKTKPSKSSNNPRCNAPTAWSEHES